MPLPMAAIGLSLTPRCGRRPRKKARKPRGRSRRAADDVRPKGSAKARCVPRVKTLRRALGLTQEEFAAYYRIPLGTLRDWEQGRTEPDQPARAYLTVIAHDPDSVRRAPESERR